MRRRLESLTVHTSGGPITFTGLPDQDVLDLDLGGINTSYVFVDPTETPDSVAWIIAHELSHQLVDEHPEVARMLDQAKTSEAHPASDRFHELDAEERLADGYATRLVGKRYDRSWWRKRAPER